VTVDGDGLDIPGWYGKLPGLGDFASRRLPDEFIQKWDGWLQQVISSAQAGLGEEWLDRYLTMPIWRFAALPGVIGTSGWAGVLMPSVDRVGRQFPLTLAAELCSPAAAPHAILKSGDWYRALETAALSALDAGRGPEDLDGALAGCGFTVPGSPELDGAVRGLRRLPSADSFEVLAGIEAVIAWSRDAGWTTLWWTRGRFDGDSLELTCAGLPTAEEFTWLVESRIPAEPRVIGDGSPQETGTPSGAESESGARSAALPREPA
jgi:type VI secretion system protein ImpM